MKAERWVEEENGKGEEIVKGERRLERRRGSEDEEQFGEDIEEMIKGRISVEDKRRKGREGSKE